MEILDLKKYNSWKNDNDLYDDNETHKYRKKGDERVKICFYKDTIQIEESNIIHPYTNIYVYNRNTKLLITYVKEIYMTEIIYRQYDNIGKLIKEESSNNDYKFSIKDLIEKIRKEYEVNLEDRREGATLNKQQDKEKNWYYEIRIDTKESPLVKKMKYILIDGETGKTLYETFYYPKGRRKSLFDEYLENKKKSKEYFYKNTSYKTFQGKTYTEEEWKAFEQEQWEKYQANRNHKSFWDKLFG
ncbi:hypothetical protein [Capnocytophaga catalasegens]|nr:hypothetical protein [Capnocytophaga catalasegens]